MIGFVLAAGFGTRLKPLTDHIPKALVSAGGKALLQRALEYLRGAGIKKIGVNGHYKIELIREFQQSSSLLFELYWEKEIRGTGGALHFARELLSSDDSFCIINSDIVTTIDLEAAINTFVNSDFDCGLCCAPCKKNQIGTIIYNQDDNLFIDTKASGLLYDQFGSADFIGVAFYRKKFLEIVNKDDFSVVPIWKRSSEKKLKAGIIPVNGYWKDTGTASSLLQLHFDILDRNCKISLPDDLEVNFENKTCYPRKFNSKEINLFGPYAWIESDDIRSIPVRNSVIFRNATKIDKPVIENVLLTQWGEISIDK